MSKPPGRSRYGEETPASQFPNDPYAPNVPPFVPPPPPPEPIPPPTPRGIIIRIIQPGEDAWSSGGFLASTEVIERAKQALVAYQKIFAGLPSNRSKLGLWSKISRSPSTGLAQKIPGRLSSAPRNMNEARELAEEWLNDPNLNVAQALFGESQWRLFFPANQSIVTTTLSNDDADVNTLGDPVRYHLRYPQWHQDKFPVFGGELDIHLQQNSADFYVTSSYMPVPNDRSFSAEFSPEQAKCVALQVLSYYQEPSRFGQIGDALHDVVQSIKVFLGQNETECINTAESVKNWRAEIFPYADQEQFIIPFAGNYFLVYRICLTSADKHQSRSVLIDVETGNALGRPSQSTSDAPILLAIKNSSEAQTWRTPGTLPTLKQEIDKDPLPSFMNIALPSQDTNKQFVWQRDAQAPPNSGAAPELIDRFRATNVAIHAGAMYDYLSKCCPPNQKEQLKSSKPIWICFYSSNSKFSQSQELEIQKDSNGAISIHKGAVISLNSDEAYDPDVVYHEVTHSLQYYLNPAPFEESLRANNVLFPLALVEGYAMYFARSLGTLNDLPIAQFASAAHADWGEKIYLWRDSSIPGEDLLNPPNRFPYASVTNPWPLVYYTGMVWARGMWDVRRLLGTKWNNVADTLALKAFIAAANTASNGFEFIAEEFERAAYAVCAIEWNDLLLFLFGLRGIIASDDVQALVAKDDAIIVGTDTGMMRLNAANTWELVESNVNSVNALLVANGRVYAASSTIVYKDSESDSQWHQVGNDLRTSVYSLVTTFDGTLFAGTGKGVFRFDTVAGKWNAFDSPDGGKIGQRQALDMALCVQGTTTVLCVAAYDALWIHPLQNHATWQRIIMEEESADPVLCVATQGADIFFGKAKVGIWQVQVSDDGKQKGDARRIDHTGSAATPDDLAVLCLASHPDEPNVLYAGTTQGVYLGQRRADGTWDWKNKGGPSGDVVFTKLAVTKKGGKTILMAATALHGFWSWTENEWSPIDQTPLPTGINRRSIQIDGATGFSIERSDKTVHFKPFYRAPNSTCPVFHVSTQIPLELWRLGPRLREIEPLQVSADPLVYDFPPQPEGGYFTWIARGQWNDKVSWQLDFLANGQAHE